VFDSRFIIKSDDDDDNNNNNNNKIMKLKKIVSNLTVPDWLDSEKEISIFCNNLIGRM
jgi:hypothetical protein